MPRIIERDAKVANSIRLAIKRIKDGHPSDAKLRRRADAGTLRVNFNTVEIESRVKRHLYDRPGTPYQAEHDAIAASIPARGSVEPLRKQLDRERRKLQQSDARLQRSRSYAAQLLAHTQKLNQEIARLNDLLAGGGVEGAADLISGARVVALPPMRHGKRAGTNGGAQRTRGVGR